MSLSLNAELQAFNQEGLSKMPPEAVQKIRHGLSELQAKGLAEKALTSGLFPDFTLPNATGKHIRLQNLLEQGPVILSFYRGSWCPYCNIELRHLQQHLSDFKLRGAQLVAISPEMPDHSLSFKEKAQLDFEVLSDVHLELAQRLGLVFDLNADLDQLYQELLGADVAFRNGAPTPQLPMPATYVLQTTGQILLAHVQADYTQRLEPQAILDVLS